MAIDEVIKFENNPVEVSNKYLEEFNSLEPNWKKSLDLSTLAPIFQENLDSENSMLFCVNELRYATRGCLVPAITTMLTEGKVRIPKKWKDDEVEITRSMFREAARMDRGDMEALDISSSRGRVVVESPQLNALNKYIGKLEEESAPSNLPIS